jgi:hypothetical protein
MTELAGPEVADLAVVSNNEQIELLLHVLQPQESRVTNEQAYSADLFCVVEYSELGHFGSLVSKQLMTCLYRSTRGTCCCIECDMLLAAASMSYLTSTINLLITYMANIVLYAKAVTALSSHTLCATMC